MPEKTLLSGRTGIVVVDVQADFTELKSGSLAVPGTDANYVNSVRKATKVFLDQGLPMYYTQDWHPANHVSFYTNNPGAEPMQVIEIAGRPQVMWPPHCVQNTAGAEILIPMDWACETVRKGTDHNFDSYSGFADDGGRKTALDSYLRRDGIENLIIFGLATDYCVKATVLNAVQAGYEVGLKLDLCRGVSSETTEKAIQEMEERGVTVLG